MANRHILGIYLVLLLAGPAMSASSETEYFAVFMEGKKVGFAIQSRVVADSTSSPRAEGKVTTTVKVSITISRADVPVTLDWSKTSIETTDGEPLGFETVQKLGTMAMKITGTVNKQGKVYVTTHSMGSEKKNEVEWPSGAVMAEGVRLLTLKKGLKEGTQYSVKIFDPVELQAIDAQIRIGPKQNVDLLGRVVTLTKVTTAYNIPDAGEIISTSYVDNDLRDQKALMFLARLHIELVACTKEFALGENDVFEVLDKMFLASPKPLGDVQTAKSITYHISPKPRAENLAVPSGDNQKVQRFKDGRIIVTVEPVVTPTGVKFPYKGTDPTILQATKPTRFVQSDRKEIIDLARQAVGRTGDAGEAVRKIEAFVARYVENKSLSVGYASAAEVAASRQGDCTEFAVLTAAMCRAVGIPSQVVTGVAYVKDFAGFQGFGGHAWTQAYIGDRWVGIDAAFNSAGRGGYGPGHIALAVGNGDPEGFFKLVNTMGQFKIDMVIVNK